MGISDKHKKVPGITPRPMEAIEAKISLLSSIVGSSGDAIIGTTPDSVITSWNQAAERIFGYKAEEIIGNSVAILFTADQRTQMDQILEKICRGEKVEQYETVWRSQSGSHVPLSLTVSPVYSTGRLIDTVFICRDITERRQMEEALRFSESHYRAIYRDNPTMMTTLDIDLTMLSVNLLFASNLGYTTNELEGQSVLKVFHEDDRSAVAEWLRMSWINPGQVHSCPFRALRKDGNLLLVEEIAQTVYGLNGALNILLMGQDITERKRVEEALKQQQQLMQNAERLASVGSWQWDIDDDVWTFSDNWYRMHGVGRRSMSVEELMPIAHPDDRAAVQRAFDDVIRNGKPYDIQHRIIRQDTGEVRYLQVFGELVAGGPGRHRLLIGEAQDITERKRTEEELRQSEERFRLMADAAPVMIWEAGPDAGCTFFNRTWLQYTGRKMEQELGQGWTQGVHPDDLQRCVDTYLSAFKDRIPFSMEYRLRRSDGEYGWIFDTGVPRLTPDGYLLGYIGSCFDITERKLAREELQQVNEFLAQRVAERTAELSETIESLKDEINERIRMGQALREETTERLNAQAELRAKELLLLQQSRLAAMGEMIGNIAHQWRQPLNMLGLLAQDLAMTYKKGEFNTQYLEANVRKVLETIGHMSKTIDDFRNFFRPDKEKMDFRIVEMVEKTLSLLEVGLNAQRIRAAVVSDCDPVVNGYPSEFSQVLLNVMTNARDALVSKEVASPSITIEIGTEGGRSVVTITDNAGGIPEDIIDKIFDPYFTTKGPDKGTGVGLYMSKIIIEKNMSGSLSARNVAGGAQFRIAV